MNGHEYVAKTGGVPAWPCELRRNRDTALEAEVLVVGGIAGCRATSAVENIYSEKFAAQISRHGFAHRPVIRQGDVKLVFGN